MTNWPSFDEVPAITPDELAVWLAMTGTANNWPTKTRIVGLIGSRYGGDYWTAEQVGRPLGRNVAYTSRLLLELERDQVIWRDGGAGDRLYWVEVNPRAEQWRGVDWTVSRFERSLLVSSWREAADLGAVGRLFARPCGARRDVRVARFMIARRGDVEGATSRDSGSRDVGARGGTTSRDAASRDVVTPFARPKSARQFGRRPEVVLPRPSDTENSPSLGGADGEEESKSEIDPALHAACQAVVAKSGARFLKGRPVKQLGRILERIEIAELVGLVAQAPDDLGAPRLVEWLDLRAGAPDVSTAVDPADRRAELERALANRRAMLEVYERTESDPEVIESCRAELVACENELAAL